MYRGYPPQGNNGFAVAGFVVSAIAFVLSWIPLLGIPIGHSLGVIGLILSIIGMVQASRLGSGGGMAVFGLVLSIITIVLKSIPILNLL
ncbi:hypothetical protein [Alicyclobacillus fastidiosus]|uniref:DUF4190 domain-containing protein n=1 Tax=Alicyclobacillus fastidiosus TaxID=392011 RepID=A0ABV5AES5_9BACL|nr:hypothetical protein [Alicyclobacillus fastidiosus]WEH09739.1 hypothetical protein PYS47_00065 [Alicyclobacillus fastidiosus]